MTHASELFATVAVHDPLGFWADGRLQARRVVGFLSLEKADVATLADIAPKSVRYDEKIPKALLARLQEIANVCSLVAQYFGGDVVKTQLWFKTTNSLLGNTSPRDMLLSGRFDKLQRFVVAALKDNEIDSEPTSANAAMIDRAVAIQAVSGEEHGNP